MFLDPERMTNEFQKRIVRWLEANGVGDWVALEPIIVRGNVVEFVSMGRGSRRRTAKVKVRGDEVVTEVRKVRIRIPLAKVA